MEGKGWGDLRPESSVSAGSGSVDLAQFGVRTPSTTHNVHRRVNSACSVGANSLTKCMSEELRFKLEMRRMELEAEAKARRLKM